MPFFVHIVVLSCACFLSSSFELAVMIVVCWCRCYQGFDYVYSACIKYLCVLTLTNTLLLMNIDHSCHSDHGSYQKIAPHRTSRFCTRKELCECGDLFINQANWFGHVESESTSDKNERSDDAGVCQAYDQTRPHSRKSPFF